MVFLAGSVIAGSPNIWLCYATMQVSHCWFLFKRGEKSLTVRLELLHIMISFPELLRCAYYPRHVSRPLNTHKREDPLQVSVPSASNLFGAVWLVEKPA